MNTKSKLTNKNFPHRIWEISEVIHGGTTEEYQRLIGHVYETPSGYLWGHSALNRESQVYFTTKAGALRGLKSVHQKHKNGLTGYI